jgi:hypothetical protein
MTFRTLFFLMLPSLSGFWSALLPAPSPLDQVRRGNAAYERGDYEAAAAAYAEAETRIADPGLAAYNKAAALYQKSVYRDAELLYRCCLEDASGSRRTHALYGIGNALVQQSHERGADVLRAAIRAFEDCLKQPGIDPALADDARHNLELVKLLLLRAQSRSSDQTPNKPDDPEQERPKPPEPRQSPDLGPEQFGPGKSDARSERKRVRQDQAKDATKSDEGSPGAGTLPPVPDQEDLAPMAREDAEEHLQRAAARILSERRAYQQQRRARPLNGSGLDW